jgi:hypothetical protein
MIVSLVSENLLGRAGRDPFRHRHADHASDSRRFGRNRWPASAPLDDADRWIAIDDGKAVRISWIVAARRSLKPAAESPPSARRQLSR